MYNAVKALEDFLKGKQKSALFVCDVFLEPGSQLNYTVLCRWYDQKGSNGKRETRLNYRPLCD